MLSKENLRAIFLHEFKLGRNGAEAYQNIVDAWGEGSTSQRTVRWWFVKFQGRNFDLNDEEGKRGLLTTNTQN
uniref:HTH_48 domain-containing protein n=1 Tax=Strongyloides papillosus TaxID=174720 RepID=A0A0N5BIQ8_STREA